MTKTEHRKIVKQIAQACEKAYRRGYQQGHLYRRLAPQVTEDDVAKWRAKGSVQGYAVNRVPPGHPRVVAIEDLMMRLKCEIGFLTELRQFIYDARPKPKRKDSTSRSVNVRGLVCPKCKCWYSSHPEMVATFGWKPGSVCGDCSETGRDPCDGILEWEAASP